MKWPLLSIGEICVDTAQRDPREQSEVYFRYVDIASIDRETKRIVEPSSVVGKDAPSRARKEIKTDDVLVSTVRPNLNAVAIVPDELDGEIASTGFCVLRTDQERADPRYLYYHTRSNDFINYLADRVTGANYPAVTDKVVKEAPIPVPPLDEQHRIVRILDEAEGLRQLRARADERMAEFIPALFNQMFGPSAVKHSDWAYANLTELCVHSDDIRCGPFGTQLQRHEYRSNGIPLWSIAHVNSHFSIPTNDYLTPEKALALENYSLMPGDIVMTRKATVGNCTVYPATLPKGIMHSDLLRIRLDTARCLPDFLASALALSQEVKAQIDMVTSGATTQGINVTRLKNISIHVPPLALQCDFAARVAEARALQDQQAQSRSRLEAGFQALLHRAFAGEL